MLNITPAVEILQIKWYNYAVRILVIIRKSTHGRRFGVKYFYRRGG